MACVGNDNDLREVVPGEGRRAFTGVSKGAFVVVHTTALAEPRQNSSALLQPELTMLSPFASTHSKVAEQQVIRTFVTGGLSVEESLVQFASWEEASKAGKLALNQFLQTPLGSRFIRPAHA